MYRNLQDDAARIDYVLYRMPSNRRHCSESLWLSDSPSFPGADTGDESVHTRHVFSCVGFSECGAHSDTGREFVVRGAEGMR